MGMCIWTGSASTILNLEFMIADGSGLESGLELKVGRGTK